MTADGIYLIEVDRVLRPGGYWILSGPPIRWKKYWRGWERSQEDLKQEQDAIEDVAKRLCWKKVVEKNDLSIWQKPINHVNCIKSRAVYHTPPMCKLENADVAWYVINHILSLQKIKWVFYYKCIIKKGPNVIWGEKKNLISNSSCNRRYKDMETCISALPEVSNTEEVAGGGLEKWPERAFTVPPRISSGSISGITAEKLKEDNGIWKERVANYKRIVSPLVQGQYRNVMDMNAHLGGFAAALSKYPVWVMNVVPTISTDTLGIIYERGFIGTYHDWCEAFSTYPRTYDLIHASGVFSMYESR